MASAQRTATKEIVVHKAMLSDPSTASPTSSESSMIAKRYKINQRRAPVAALRFKAEEFAVNVFGSVCPSKLVADETADEKANNLHGKAGSHIYCGRESGFKENHPENHYMKEVSYSEAIVDERGDDEIWRETNPWDCLSLDEGPNSMPVRGAPTVVAVGSTRHMPLLRVRSNHTAAASKEGMQISCKVESDEAPGRFSACDGTQTAWTTALAAVTTASSAQLEDSVRAPVAIGAAMSPRQRLSRATRGRQGVSAVEGSLQHLVPVAGCDLSPAAKDAVDPYPVTFDLLSASTAAYLRTNSERRSGRVCALSRTVSWVYVARVLIFTILAQLCQRALADTYAYNVPDTEIAALQDLYDATNGASWTWSGTGNLWNFTDPNPCYDHWQGINCTQAPSDGFLHVLAVNLPGFGLAGSIPDSMTQLTQLQLLYLTTNDLTGTIPASLGLLVQLTGLGLDYNKLTGPIPESLQQLTLLTDLYLDSNQLAGTIPASLGQLTRLTFLFVDDNHLTGTIPESLQQLTQLTELYLDNNQLTGSIPASLGQLMQMTILYLGFNSLTGTIPESLQQLTHLTELYLDENQLTGTIPTTLGSLIQLQILGFDTNLLTGTISASLGQLTQLTFLFVNDNHLTGTIPESLQQLTQLMELYLNSNLLTGTIPASLGQLTRLTFLFVDDNHLTGTIPESLQQLTQLTELYLDANLLTGTIPASLGQLMQMTILYLGFNSLTGTIPESLQQLTQLTELYLDNNQLIGSIPASLGQLTQLQILGLDTNQLTGTIFDSLAQLTQLTFLFVNDNHLTGTIPESLQQLTQLTELYLGANQLTGTIPASLAKLAQLTFLLVNDNHLTGIIPESLQQLTQLTNLYLDSNQLTGTIPASLGSLAQLQILGLDANQLTGTIFDSVAQLTQLNFLLVNHNHLTGTIPESLQQLAQLTELYLGANQLTGTIPASLGQLTRLTFLLVDDNHLTGTIPESLQQLTQLTELYLDSNLLTGSIPASLGQLMQMTILYLDYNSLTGTIPQSLQQLTRLTELYLDSNLLTGTIPASLGQLTHMTILYLDFNSLTGTIPESLQQPTHLTELYLDENQLTGTIPTTLGSLTQLQILGLDNNQLTGTISASLGQLMQLTFLFVDGNHLTGTIPASLGLLTRLQILTLGSNRLTGTVPESFEHLTKMIFFGVSDNWLTGTIPGLFAQLTQVIVLRLENNLLTGTIPAYLGQLPTLTVLELGFNLFTGSIPQNWSTAAATMQVLHLNVNQLSSTIPESVGHMPLLLSLNLSSNHLTGTIPASFQQLCNLQVLMLHNNQLRGSIFHLFGSQQRNLSTVQLSGNQLTGSLPDAAFLLPGLTSFAAVDNCFEGTLPVDAICSSASLNALVLDGLHSASPCKRGAYHQSFKLGCLPACLLSMANLATLHLSGSGLTGSLPADANISAVLRDLSLSHNLLTGKMPDNVLHRDWDKLDLSYNRLTGTLHGASTAPYSNTTELRLQHNRLSGVIPGSMQHVGSLSLLEDNMFSCRVDGSDVPQQDSDSDKYTCGSDAVNNALYVWLGAVLAAALAVGSAVWQTQRMVAARDWLRAVTTATTPKLQSIFQAAELLGVVGAGAAAYCILVLLPVYAAVSEFHPTYTYKYAWTVSGVFLSGIAAFAVEATFLLVQLLICGYMTELLITHAPAAAPFPAVPVSRAITKGAKGTSTTARVVVVLLSLVVVTGINAGFVLATLRLNGRQLTVVQILLAVFKLGYNNIVAPALQNRVVSKHDVTASLLMLVLLNVIAIPCLVVMVISPACFYDAITGCDPVTSNYNYGGSCQFVDIYNDGKVACEGFDTEVGTTTYTPAFTYSYQCSSSFVTYYAPTFVIMCIISGFLLPALRVLLLWLRCVLSPTSCLYSVVNAVTPRILKELWSEQDVAQARRDPLYRPVFNANRWVMSLLTYLALLLTFGALFPPLAVCCAVAMASVVLTARLEVGRYLAAAVGAGRQDCLDEVESACVGVATPQQLRMALGLILAVSCMFYTLFLFDTLGDAVGFAGAFWVLIVVPLLPVVALGLYRAAGMGGRRWAAHVMTESTVDPEVGMELNSIPEAADSLDRSSVAVPTGNSAKGEPDDVPSSSRVNPMHAP